LVQTEPDRLTRLGGWLFRRRTALPLPVAAAILTLRIGQAPPSSTLIAAGIVITALGEAVRLWGVRHIGAVSRTRSDRLGPLVTTGPFAHVRNPLYLGNIALWIGFALTAQLVWLAAVAAVLLALEYHAIVRWEERLLEARVGDAYREYLSRVPRWVPRTADSGRTGLQRGQDPSPTFERAAISSESFSWRQTLFSERVTFVAIAVGYLLLWIKARF
jgi:protein-S-isoprenylcysteine O-methyltransferase Ste14